MLKDIVGQMFITDYHEFKLKLLDIEKRLGSVVCQAFDDCNSCEAIFKVSHLHVGLILTVHVLFCGQILHMTAESKLIRAHKYSLSYLA